LTEPLFTSTPIAYGNFRTQNPGGQKNGQFSTALLKGKLLFTFFMQQNLVSTSGTALINILIL